jgi:hypothetical protein
MSNTLLTLYWGPVVQMGSKTNDRQVCKNFRCGAVGFWGSFLFQQTWVRNACASMFLVGLAAKLSITSKVAHAGTFVVKLSSAVKLTIKNQMAHAWTYDVKLSPLELKLVFKSEGTPYIFQAKVSGQHDALGAKGVRLEPQWTME